MNVADSTASWGPAGGPATMNCGKKAPKKSSVFGLVSETRSARVRIALGDFRSGGVSVKSTAGARHCATPRYRR